VPVALKPTDVFSFHLLDLCEYVRRCMPLLCTAAVPPAKHRLAKRGRIRLREIKNEPFLLLREGHCFRENAISACQRSNLDPSIVFESGQFSGILAMVSAGMGVSIAPAMAVEKRKGCKFIRVDDDHACRKVGLVQRRNHFSTRSQRALIDHLKQMHKQSSGQS
jgi:LysR family hydrogen peroxide-inducible transcriptional activator